MYANAYERDRMVAAQDAVGALMHALNGSVGWKEVAAAIGKDHGYLVHQLVVAVAAGVLRKCWPGEQSCGEVMGPLANGPNWERDSAAWKLDREARIDHPYHDGELACNEVRAALIVVGIPDWPHAWRKARISAKVWDLPPTDPIAFWRGDK